MKLILVVVLLIFFPSVSMWEESIYGVTVKVKEMSGEITISNDNNTMKLSFYDIVELALNGETRVGAGSTTKHSYNNFAFLNLIGSPREIVEVVAEGRNISAVRKNFTATLVGMSADFMMQLLIYDNKSIVPLSHSGEIYQVFNGTVTVGFSFNNWKFCGFNDTACEVNGNKVYGKYLDVYVSVTGARKGSAVSAKYRKASTKVGKGRKPVTMDYGGGEVSYSQQYRINDTWYQMADGYPKSITKGDRNYAVIRFPVFYSEIYYAANVNVSLHKFVSSSTLVTSLPFFCSTLSVTLVLLTLFW